MATGIIDWDSGWRLGDRDRVYGFGILDWDWRLGIGIRYWVGLEIGIRDWDYELGIGYWALQLRIGIRIVDLGLRLQLVIEDWD